MPATTRRTSTSGGARYGLALSGHSTRHTPVPPKYSSSPASRYSSGTAKR
ncbi:Uncharacterized protein pbN1_28890 [Aromatoleum bremense]|nr:Uncharacterized protein pbN1_28890 [Aromatoleum bremense]